MAENLSEDAKILARLVSLSRNKYFYGKLLTERELTLEQSYMNRKRWLLNRLGLGSGVLCGLEVEASQDGACLMVHPGVAIDPLGREIIVPEAYCLPNLRQPTDCQGKPLGDPVHGAGTLYLCLCYKECDSGPVPVLVSDCDSRQDCAANFVRERYCLRICTEITPVPGLPCGDIFPVHQPLGFDQRLAAEKALSGDCAIPASECVVLADVILPADVEAVVTVDMFAHRTMLFSNQTLFDLLICLADEVEACCQTKLLQYVSGDAQSTQVGTILKDSLVVKVVDGDNKPVANEPVTFQVRGGGGSLTTAANVNSNANGQASARLKLGPNAGLNTVAASIANGSNVVFSALAIAVQVKPPVILKTTPANGVRLTPDQQTKFLDEGLEITFDRNMLPGVLAKPDAWLGAWLVQEIENADGAFANTVRPVLKYVDHANGGPAADVFYFLDGWQRYFSGNMLKQNIRLLLVIQAANNNIVSHGDKVLLDAEFAGTRLDFNKTGLFMGDHGLKLLDALQKMNPGDHAKFDIALFKGLSSDGTAPAIPATGTGDGNPGGLFHSYIFLY